MNEQPRVGKVSAAAKKTAWGRSRFGGGGWALFVGSLAIGLPIALGLVWLEIQFGKPSQPWLFFWVLLLAQLPITTVGGWAVLVDRSTIKGAVKNTEDTIENQWYTKATSGAFLDIFVLTGVGSAVTAYLDLPLTVSWTLTILAIFSVVDFGVRYLWLRRTA